MNKSVFIRSGTLRLVTKGLILIFVIPVLGVWTAGSLVCSVVAVLAAVLNVFNWDGITVILYPGYSLPRLTGLPLGLLLALLLLITCHYARRCLRICLQFINS